MRTLTESGVKARYSLQYEAIKKNQQWTKFARKVNTVQPNGEDYRGSKGVRGPGERKGQNIRSTVPTEVMHIYNRNWDGGLQMPKDDWEFDKTSEMERMVDKLATFMASHPGELISDTMIAGKTIMGADGAYFYSAAHPGDTNQTNILGASQCPKLNVATVTAPTSAEWADLLVEVAVYMMLRTDDVGNFCNLGTTSFTVAVPPGLFPSLLQATSSALIGDGITNYLLSQKKFKFEPMMIPGWTETDAFLMIADGQSGFIYQELREPKVVETFGPGSEYYKLNDEFYAKATGTYNTGVDSWQATAWCDLT